MIEEAAQPLPILILSGQEPPGIVASLGRHKTNLTVDRIEARDNSNGRAAMLGYERQPLHNFADTLEVVFGGQVGHTVLVHDLGAAELEVGGVDLTTEHLVQCGSTSQDDWLTLVLDGALAEADEVSADADGTAGDEGDGEDVVVRAGGGAGDETGATQVLDTEAVGGANHVCDPVPGLAGLHNFLRQHRLLPVEVDLLEPVRILEALSRVLRVDERGPDERGDLVGEANAGAGAACHLRCLEEYLVLGRAERTDLERDVVGDDDDPTALGRLGREEGENPRDHAASVGAGRTLDLLEVLLLVEDELDGVEEVSGDLNGGVLFCCALPLILDGLAEQLREVVDVGRAHEVGLVAAGL
ncbi:hypothetical protein BC938DRAFT_471232 [Jimgerdemannia flammicorona]|uniref:Uncharacterized protein n=1 Tax=Jimgerdemannia flammicorona TaxID=994334 RepID=A0A433Q8G9_9FUNG|nr:hypothetical protein BC938DRAFT_471232 [Jimgerdemannia flammicorona]